MTARHGIGPDSQQARILADRIAAMQVLNTALARSADSRETRRLSQLRLFVLTGRVGERAS